MTVQVFVRDHRTVIAAPVQCDVDGIPKGSHLPKRKWREGRRCQVPFAPVLLQLRARVLDAYGRKARTTSTFSCDIAYSRSPAASRAPVLSEWKLKRKIVPSRIAKTNQK